MSIAICLQRTCNSYTAVSDRTLVRNVYGLPCRTLGNSCDFSITVLFPGLSLSAASCIGLLLLLRTSDCQTPRQAGLCIENHSTASAGSHCVSTRSSTSSVLGARSHRKQIVSRLLTELLVQTVHVTTVSSCKRRSRLRQYGVHRSCVGRGPLSLR